MTRLRWAVPAVVPLVLFMLFGCSNGTTINATPQISGLFPSEITAGSQGFTLFVSGTQFISTSTVQFNGSNRPTTFNTDSTQLMASITAADVQNSGIASVTVTSPAPGGGVSLAASFTINSVHSGAPTIMSISPSSAALNAPAFTLMVTGTNFAPSDFVTWNGGVRQTMVTSATQLSAQILATDLTQQMMASVAVHTSQLGVASPSVSFQVGSSSSADVMPQLVSVNAFGGPADGASSSPAPGATGRFVAFRSEAKNLVSEGASGNIFVRDTCLGAAGCTPRTLAVDLTPDGSPPNGIASGVAISADGRYVAFASRATNLVPQTAEATESAPIWRVFLRDTCLSGSADAATTSTAPNCSPHTELVSLNVDGVPVDGSDPALSGDGRFVAFTAPRERLVFMRDTCHGVAAGQACAAHSVIASTDGAGGVVAATNAEPAISLDGRYVVFAGVEGADASLSSRANAKTPSQIFLRDTCSVVPTGENCTGSTTRISVAPDGSSGNGVSKSASVSANGRFVVFESAASNLTPDSRGRVDVYLRDTCLGPTAPFGCAPFTRRISNDAELRQESFGNYAPLISPSGRFITYAAQTARDSTSDSAGPANLIMYDTCAGAVGACSAGPVQVLAPDGAAIALHLGNSGRNLFQPTADGRFIVFFTPESLGAQPTSGLGDVFLSTTGLTK